MIFSGELIDKLQGKTSAFSPIELWGFIDPSPLNNNDNQPKRYFEETRLLVDTAANGKTRFVAPFPYVVIPDGLWIDTKRQYTSRPAWEEFALFYGTNISFTVTVENPGEFEGLELKATIGPDENWKEGQDGQRLTFLSESEDYSEMYWD